MLCTFCEDPRCLGPSLCEERFAEWPQDFEPEGPEPAALPHAQDAPAWEPEGEPYEDTYLPGIPDYDRFNRPSWGEEEA